MDYEIAIERALYKKSLYEYVKGAFSVLEPATEFKDNWHIELICEYLTLVTQGKITRLIINIPPRYMKSLIITVFWPTWDWVNKPENRFLCASYSHGLSVSHSRARRTVLKSPWYRKRFYDSFIISEDHDTKGEYSNNKQGYMGATSMSGTATGKGGNRIIIDDPLNPKEAYSDIQRNTVNMEFDQTFTTRLDDKEKGAIVVVMQRLHENDLTGHLFEKGGWQHLCLPAIAEKDEEIIFPISGKKIVRKEGDILWPERENENDIKKMKVALGSYGFSGQYQQRPTPKEGGLFKKHWWQFYTKLPEKFDIQIQSWDLAFKDTISSAYVVCQIWGTVGSNRYLIYQLRERLDFPNTLRAIASISSKYPDTTIKLIEDKANGPAVISVLKSKIPGIIPVEPDGSKEARASAISYLVEAGNVYLPSPEIAPWIDDFIEECGTFPLSIYKDQVDAMTQALSRLEKEAPIDLSGFSMADNLLDRYNEI